ncbi:MAG: DUF3488 and transglutaminase-like domain-containing protein [Tahibacter sp.]
MNRLNPSQFDLLTLASGVAIVAHMPHLPLWFNASLCILLAIRWSQRHWRAHWGAAPIWLRLPMTLALPTVIIAQYGNLFGREPGSALAVGLLVLKLGESERPRDARAAVTFACFVLMAALLFDQGLVISVLIVLGLIPQLLALRALEPQPPGVDASSRKIHQELRVAIPSALLALAAAAPLAIAMFLFLPRLAQPLWGTSAADSNKTGLSDRMTPGSMGELLTDDSAAFRVGFSGPPPPAQQRYWRSLVLSRFDGTTWWRARSALIDPGSPGFEALGAALDYELTLEPTQQTWLVALDLPALAPQGFLRNDEFSLIGDKPVSETTRYHLRSILDYRLRDLSPRLRRASLVLPPGFNPRAQELAQQWRHQWTDDRAVIAAALQRFHDQFTYTLAPPPLGLNSVDDFLFDTRAGYCEHFSSAFVVLMRAAGIPARVVVGYQGGYWNEFGQYLVVRQSDAHAWAEIWRDDAGWIRVDPTAAVSPVRVQLGSHAASAGEASWFGSSWLLGMRNRWDLVNRLWNQAIVQFNTLQQQGLLTKFGIERADWNQLAIAFGICCALLLGLGLVWALRRDRRTGDALDRHFSLLERKLARAGHARLPSQGPTHFAERLAPQQPGAAGLIEQYIRLRYAQMSPDPHALLVFARSVTEFRVAGVVQKRIRDDLEPRNVS